MNNYLKIATDILDVQKGRSYCGYDPFDGLNSKLFTALGFQKNSFLRLAWLQVNKRLPLNVRPLALTPKARNPKGIGLFILGLVNDYQRTGDKTLLSEIQSLADWLLANRSSRAQWHGSCWGYHFPWQAKAFYVPVGKPNVITTVYCSRALYAAAQLDIANAQGYLDAALDSAQFIERHLLTVDASGSPFVAYIPGEQAFVHNASLWGAAWMLFAGLRLDKSDWVAKGKEVVDRSVAEQGKDGEWVYGAMPHHQFIDGFHTGYNLEAIHLVANELNTTEYAACIEKGLGYYREHFFGCLGEPKYYVNNPYPYDVHSTAQAVLTLLEVGDTAEDKALAEKTLQWTVEKMYLPKQHRFIYQINRFYKNRVDYIRWTQAWAYLMLTRWNLEQGQNSAE